MKYELTITRYAEYNPSVDVIKDNDLLSLLAQFQLILARLGKLEREDLKRELLNDDDIPF